MKSEKFYRKSAYKKEEKEKLMTNSTWLEPFWQYLCKHSQQCLLSIHLHAAYSRNNIWLNMRQKQFP